jgi:SPP1 family predicted phage head-tail adaptor
MALWGDEITLITLQTPAERVNSNGFPNPATEIKNTVFCNKKPVGYSEYYRSQQLGITVEFKADVHTLDYAGEELAEYEGKRYTILKRYEIDDEITELTLSDLRQQPEESGG